MTRRDLTRGVIGAFGLGGAALGQGPVPRPSPEFTMTLPDGKKMSLSQFRGKCVAVAFLSSTCAHCQQLTPKLSALHNQYTSRGAMVFGALFNENAQLLLPEFIRKYGPTFPLGHSTPNDVYGFMQLTFMRQWYVPMMAFVDRKGVIRAQYTGADAFFKGNEEANVRGMIETLLKDGGGPASSGKKKAS
jgi:peroxiredoxin